MTFDQMIRETMLEMLRYDPEVKKQMTDLITDSLNIEQDVERIVEKYAYENQWVSSQDLEDTIDSRIDEALSSLSVEISR